MIDIIGAITLAGLGVGIAGALVATSPLDPRRARRLLAVAGTWFTLVTVLAALGAFTRFGPVPIAFSVLAPIAVVLLSAGAGSSVRAVALGVPVALLIALNASRVLGAFFLLLHADGRLPATFASSAGWGDIVVGVLAVPVAWLAYRRAPYWRPLGLAWNALGFVDLVAAVTIGFGSAPGSPIRFIVEDAAPGTIGMLPWLLIPGFLVPLYLLSHVALFARLAADRHPSHTSVLANVRSH